MKIETIGSFKTILQKKNKKGQFALLQKTKVTKNLINFFLL